MAEGSVAITVIDFFLQLLKKAERAYFSRNYKKLASELKQFERPEFRYDGFPDLGAAPSVLIFKPDDIGDAVYALPAVARFKEKFPAAKVYVLCQKKTAPIYELSGLFEKVVGVEITARFIRFQSLELKKTLAAFGDVTFDAAFFLRSYPAFFRMFAEVPARVKVHPQDPRFHSDSPWKAYISLWGDRRAHQAEQMLQIVARVTGEKYGDSDVRWPAFRWTAEDRAGLTKTFGEGVPEKFVVVHPFARFETRRYPYHYWRDVIGELQVEFPDFKWVIIGGKEDPSLNLPHTIEMQGKLKLRETGYLLSRAHAFLGNESGPGHWAAALGKPVITLLSGHSHESEWGVWGSHKLNLRMDVPCQNCYLRACPKYKVRCLTEMTPDLVVPRIVRFLDKP